MVSKKSTTKGVTKVGAAQKSRTRSKSGCTACKKSKLKCDEVHPSCTRCLKRGTYCSYPLPMAYQTKKTAESCGKYTRLLMSMKENKKVTGGKRPQLMNDDGSEPEPMRFIMVHASQNDVSDEDEAAEVALAAQAAQEAQESQEAEETQEAEKRISRTVQIAQEEQKAQQAQAVTSGDSKTNETVAEVGHNIAEVDTVIDPSLEMMSSSKAETKEDTSEIVDAIPEAALETSTKEMKKPKVKVAELVESLIEKSMKFPSTQAALDFSDLVKIRDKSQ
jgi:hypothetical protein